MTMEMSVSGVKSFGFMLIGLMFMVSGLYSINEQYNCFELTQYSADFLMGMLDISLFILFLLSIFMVLKNSIPEAVILAVSAFVIMWTISRDVIAGASLAVLIIIAVALFYKVEEKALAAFSAIELVFVVIVCVYTQNLITGFGYWPLVLGIMSLVVAAVSVFICVKGIMTIENE